MTKDQQGIITDSHQFTIQGLSFDDGQKMAKQLRKASLLTCGTGLLLPEIDGDMNDLRLGTPEMICTGMQEQYMQTVAGYIADSILERRAQDDIARDVSEFRKQFDGVEFIYKYLIAENN